MLVSEQQDSPLALRVANPMLTATKKKSILTAGIGDTVS